MTVMMSMGWRRLGSSNFPVPMRAITAASICALQSLQAGMGGAADDPPPAATGIILVPASPPVEAATAEQKHNDDDDEKSLHVRISPLTKALLVHIADQGAEFAHARAEAPIYFFKASCTASVTRGADDPVFIHE
jgi:hypothetical protein